MSEGFKQREKSARLLHFMELLFEVSAGLIRVPSSGTDQEIEDPFRLSRGFGGST
jgi:hypothetical protein